MIEVEKRVWKWKKADLRNGKFLPIKNNLKSKNNINHDGYYYGFTAC